VQEARQPQREKASARAAKREEVLEVVPEDTAAERVPKSRAEFSRAHVSKPKPQSAAARQMLALLRSPSSLATAVLLKEVLDRPLCQRRGGRGMMP
jgi:hypothetical protein